MTHVRQCGTPSCATSAQERTGYIVVMHLSWNTDKPISPLDSKMTHTGYIVLHPCDPYMTLVRQCGTPSCTTSAQERTGYMVVMHLSWNTDNAQERTGYSCPQLRTPAPRSTAMSWSIPATLRCPQLRTAAPRSTAMSWYP